MINLLVISNAPIIDINDQYFAYSPYVSELEIWNNHADTISFCCPIWNSKNGLLASEILFKINKIFGLKDFNVKGLKNALLAIPIILNSTRIIYNSIKVSNHIHIRCPGNVGLLACIVQIFFPKKIKTAKYAGNWDPKAKNPLSYKLQKWILSNTFLTKNMQVLIYGEWENQTKNIKPFFTATFKESDKNDIILRNFENQINFLFVGMLTKGKNPLYAIQMVEKLKLKFINVNLSIFGEGLERAALEKYIKDNNLVEFIFLKGNQDLETIKKAYSESHFLMLPSKSEGWPKAVAEAMFWGCLPISTAVSCVESMLDGGNRGILLNRNLETDVEEISNIIKNEKEYHEKVLNAVKWSRRYTLDFFEQEIKLLLSI